MDYEYCVFIGRFQPLHNSHLKVIKEALTHAKKLIIVIGSTNAAFNIKNPWNFGEREDMIRCALTDKENQRIEFVGVGDHFYKENAWITEVQQAIHTMTKGSDSVALIGTYKDESSYYIKLFPQWDEIIAKPHENMNATDIRDDIFSGAHIDGKWRSMVPKAVEEWIENNYIGADEWVRLCEEHKFIQDYKEKWKNAPFVPTFNTVDAVCIQSGHILVVKRKFHPGKGLWALPGGFIKANETLETSAIRELKEETGIKVRKDELLKHVKEVHTFDHPNRSLRGRTITQAFCIHLPDGTLPEVKGSDDAETAKWVSLHDVIRMENKFYEDHAHIINYFTSKF